MMRNQSQQNESRIPNVYWRSLSLDTLRRESRATGLPPVDSSHAGQAPHARCGLQLHWLERRQLHQ